MPRRGRLPVPAGTFVGRAAELDQIARRIASGTRIVTLVGPPGTGKTRLALEAARRLASAAPTWAATFVDLSASRSLDEMVSATAATLGVRARPSALTTEVTDALASALAGERTLLVLDNLEQLVSAAGVPEWLSALVERTSGLTLIATSRELLRVRGELAVEVPPLGVPSADASAEHARTSESVALLFSAAPQAPPPEDTEALAAIARALDGIPLALELAASRLPVMGASALRLRLEESLSARLDLLGRGRRDAPDRQATLRGAFDWSWALLSIPEARAMSALALVRGRIGADVAERIVSRVADADSAKPKAAQLSARPNLDVLAALRDKSLVARAEDGSLHVLESLRAYALERLATLDDAGTLRRGVVMALGDEAARLRTALRGARATAAFAALDRLREPLRSALEVATALLAVGKDDGLATKTTKLALELSAVGKDDELATRTAELALALEAVRVRLGLSGSLEPVLSQLRAHAALSPAVSAEVAAALARLLRDRGELAQAASVLETAAQTAAPGEARTLLCELGEMLLSQGRFDDARPPVERARESARQAGDERAEQRAEAVLGLLFHGRGSLVDAEAHYARALDLAHRLGDARTEAHALRDLGNLSLQRGEHDRALALYESALELAAGGDHRLEGVVRGNLAILRQERGALDDALSELRRALTCLRAVGDRPFEGQLLGYLGAVQHERGQIDAAAEAYAKAIAILREVRDVRLEGVFLAARASALAQKGAIGHAKNDLVVASRRLEEVGDPTLLAALALHDASVMVAEARDGTEAERASASRAALSALERTASLAASSDDVRFAARMLRRALPKEALVVAEEGAWFSTEGGDRVDLSTRRTLAKLLDALVRARLARPGDPIAWDELLAAGWPGERVQPGAAQNRVRVALTSLRNLGLRSVLLTRPGGHCLDPAVRVERGRS